MTSIDTHAAEQEQKIWLLAGQQHGVVSRSQLLAVGLTPKSVHRRLKAGRLRQIHRGVYLIGPVVSPRVREMAAVLACDGRAVLSHRTAATLWALCPPVRGGGEVEVIVAGGSRPRIPGVRAHRLRTLRSDEITVLDGVPLTTPARTLLDVSATSARRDLERQLAHALRSALLDHSDIELLLARYPSRAGTRRLRAVLAAGHPPALTRSEAEERFLALIRRAQLPNPETNVKVSGYEVDFFWRGARLVVEIDGFAFHSSAEMFESDRRRDAVLVASGVQVVRLTYPQLVKEPEALLARIAQAIALGGLGGRSVR